MRDFELRLMRALAFLARQYGPTQIPRAALAEWGEDCCEIVDDPSKDYVLFRIVGADGPRQSTLAQESPSKPEDFEQWAELRRKLKLLADDIAETIHRNYDERLRSRSIEKSTHTCTVDTNLSCAACAWIVRTAARGKP